MGSNQPILFLDIDGPIVTGQSVLMNPGNKWDAERFEHQNVKVLNSILDLTGAEIVISSDWRHHYTLNELQDIFEHFGVNKKPIDVVCDFSKRFGALDLEGARSSEILEWLKTNGSERKWVAVDDLALAVPNFVHIKRTMEGIKQTGIKDKILKFLL